MSEYYTDDAEVELDSLMELLSAAPSQEMRSSQLPEEYRSVNNGSVERNTIEGEDVNTLLLRKMEEDKGWSPANIETREDGSTSAITIKGNSEEFQGMGKYATPTAFMAANPEGFRQTNPILAAQMEQKAQTASRVFQSQAGGATIGNINERVSALGKITDQEQLVKGVLDLDGDISSAKQEQVNAIRQRTEASLNLNTLQEKLRQSEELDRQNPLFLKSGGKDSIETTLIRKELTTASKSYNTELKNAISTDPILVSLDKTSKLLGTMSSFHLRNLEKSENKAEASAAKLAQEITQFKNQLGDSEKYLPALFPSTYDKPEVLMDQWKAIPNEQKKLIQSALLVAEDKGKLLQQSLAGNPFATKIVIHNAAALGDAAQSKTSKDIERLSTIVQSPAVAMDAVQKMMRAGWDPAAGVTDPKERTAIKEAFKKDMNLFADPHNSKVGKERSGDDAIRFRMMIATEAAKQEATFKLTNDVSLLSSSGARPAWIEAMATDPKLSGKKTSLNDVMTYINTKDNFKERQQMLSEFKSYWGGAIGDYNKGGIVQLSGERMLEQLKVKAAQGWLMRGMEAMGEGAAIGASTYTQATNPFLNSSASLE